MSKFDKKKRNQVPTDRDINAGSGDRSPLVVSSSARELKLCIIAGEHSGDQLGAKLMDAINQRRKGRVRYFGVGGAQMASEGLVSQFPLDDVAVMGPGAILARLPKIVRRVYQTVDNAIASEPDAVIIIDAPEFTHPIAKRIRSRAPDIPIIDYVSPSVWAWRSGRARKMKKYIDHVLGLLPFEPEVMESLDGPPCSYVGHPLVEKLDWINALDTKPLAQRLRLKSGRPVLVVLPGSRTSEITKLMTPFGQALVKLIEMGVTPEIIMPVVPAKQLMIEERLAGWPIRPHLVETEEDKFAAFKLADASLAASGTVTLELAIAGCPMVVAYRVGQITFMIMRYLVKAKSAVLANLVLDDNSFPEFLHDTCTPAHLAPALAELLHDTPARRFQMKALARIPKALEVPGNNPSAAAADIVLRYADQGRKTA